MKPLSFPENSMEQLLLKAAARYTEIRKKGHDLSKQEDNFYENNLKMFKEMEQEIITLMSFSLFHLEDCIRFPSEGFRKTHDQQLRSLHKQIGEILSGKEPTCLSQNQECC